MLRQGVTDSVAGRENRVKRATGAKVRMPRTDPAQRCACLGGDGRAAPMRIAWPAIVHDRDAA
jgi:hypothetical protein